jgi:Calx-beta domain/Carboxypeptidase regulatory-like domain
MARPTTGRRFTDRARLATGGGRHFRRVGAALLAATAMLTPLLGLATQTAAHAASVPWVSINDVTKPRPTSGTTTFAFSVTLAHAVNNTVSVGYVTSNGTARSTFDYQPVSGTATFTPGKTSVTVNVTVNGTTLHTGTRYFYVYLQNAFGVTILHNPGTGTIVDTTMLPYVNVADATVTQGSGIANSAVFNVSLTAPSANPVTVRYYTSNGSAAAGTDYTSTSGTLTFPPAATTEQVTVPVTAVSIFQTLKNFYVTLYSPTNAALGDTQGQGTIQNTNHMAYISPDDVTVAEPPSGTSVVNAPIRVTSLSTFPVTVAYSTANGSAVAGTDYTSTSGTVTIPANTAVVTVPITVNASGLTSSKYFVLNLSSASAGSTIFPRGNSYITITAGAYNQLSVADTGVVDPATGTTTETFTVSLSPASGSTVTVNYQTADYTATAGQQYNATAGTLTFTPGQTTKTVPVTVNAVPTGFTDLAFQLNLSSPTGGAVIDRTTGYGVIDANSIPVIISVGTTAVTKPASGTVPETFTVSLSAASPNTVTVGYSTSNNNAVAGVDYAATSGTLSFAPGTTSKTVTVNVNGNTIAGPDLSYYLSLASPTNALIAGTNAFGIIQNPNQNPTLSINTIAIYKPQSGTSSAKLTVTLSSASPNTVTTTYSTQNGTATAGSDYVAKSGTLIFTPGVTSQTISISVNGNTLPTGDRYFYVNIGSPTNATIVSSQGLVDIIDSSVVPYLSVTATAVQKPSTGTANATFTLTLSPPSANTVTVSYTTNNGSAVAGTDFTATSGLATFPAGTSTQTVNVPVTASTVHVGDRYFYLTLSAPTNAILGEESQVTATILDPTFQPIVTVDDTGVLKPASGTTTETFNIHVYPASPNTVTVNYSTSNGSAVDGTDFVGTSGTLTFTPGQTTKPVTVTVNGSASSVPDRYFNLNISTPTNAQIPGRANGYGLIVDTVAPTSGLSYFLTQDFGITKPNSGTATEAFNVILFPAATSPVNVFYATSDGNATAGTGDYVPARGTLTFAPGTTSKTVNVTVNGNTVPAADRYFLFNLGTNSGPTQIFRGSSYGWILNNQPDSRVWVGPDLTINRGDTGSQTVNFSVSLSSPQQFPVQVDYTTNDGSAVAPDGYTAVAGTLVFTPGQTTQTVAVTVPANAAFTGVQYFFFDISNAIGTTIAASRETAYVYNLDVFAITGKVVDTTNTGLGGVTVTRTGNNQPTVAVVTAGDGTYSIPNTIDGPYVVTPTLAGSSFLPASANVTILGAGVAVPTFLAYAGKGITGLVADSKGKAVSGATVTLTGGGGGTVVSTTDSLGFYAFSNVAAGTGYVVTPTLAAHTFNPASYTLNVAATTVKNQDFVAMQGVTISGQVTATGGGGAPGVTITRTGGAQSSTTVKTNSQGYYGISNNPASAGGITYTITPTKTAKTFTPTSATATVTTSSNASGVNFVQN